MSNVSLLENGFDYIINSLNKLKTIELNMGNKYTIKYIIRDLISGIEIILKYRLECDNWAFVINDLDKLAINNYENGDFVSVTLEQSIDRLKKLCNVSMKKEDELTLINLKLIRNKIEHFKLNLNQEETISLVYNSITVILNFIDREPEYFKNRFSKEEKSLYSSIKEKIFNLDKYLNKLEQEIHNRFPDVPFKSCPKCYKRCVKVQGIKCKCYLCKFDYQDTSYERNKYIEKYQPSYKDISKGAVPIGEIDCPYCGDTMLMDYENNKAICFMCKKETTIDDIDCCVKCGRPGITGICDCCLEDIALMQWEISRGK